MISMWICFALFFVVYAIKLCNLWIVLMAWSAGLSIYLLIKNKLPSAKYIIIAVLLALVASLSYFALGFRFYLQMPLSAVSCFLASLATFSVMEKYGDYSLIRTESKTSPLISILIALAVGIVLGLINLLLAKASNQQSDFAITFPRIILSLNPGILEEITNRAIYLAFFTYFFTRQNKPATKFQTFTMMFMMTVPHCFAHGYSVVESLILLVLFGLPFAILQRKRDLTSAMLSHTIVDLIRFITFGLPV
ncbi:MAG: hypothetical protein MJ160_00015 [Treponema sp.]|nr:hypothetical protein [Treponema sp.]